MTSNTKSADTSFYYRDGAMVDVARMDSSAVYGNLADAMKNAIVVLPITQISEALEIVPPRNNRDDAAS